MDQPYTEKRPRLLILGYARHGKDTVAEMLRDNYGLKFKSSSEFVGEECLWEQWGKERYDSFQEMFDDRMNHRVKWMEMISAYNTPDKTRTATTMIERGYDMYVGMRKKDELDACREVSKFDFIIWVERPGFPPETGSMDITKENSFWNYCIKNDGTLADLERKVADLVHHLTTIQGFHWIIDEHIPDLNELRMPIVEPKEKYRQLAEEEEMQYQDFPQFDLVSPPLKRNE